MTREDLIKVLADAFKIESDENGEYDLNDYDWEAGCSFYGTGVWLSLKNVVNAIEESGYLED